MLCRPKGLNSLLLILKILHSSLFTFKILHSSLIMKFVEAVGDVTGEDDVVVADGLGEEVAGL